MSLNTHESSEFTCDGCGATATGEKWADRQWHKPRLWYQRSDADGDQLACSRDCIDVVAKETGKTRAIFPW